MMERKSRMDFICEQLFKEAEGGSFEAKMELYPSEVKRISKQLKVVVVADNNLMSCNNKKYACIISWNNAFTGCKLNYRHSWYMSRLSDEIPETESVAQRLFLITARSRNSMNYIRKCESTARTTK